jgi:TAT-translocated FGD2 family F420-dependent dehydrogenase
MQTPDVSEGLVALSVESGPTIGFVLSNEQFPASQLIEWGEAAEQAGFNAISHSDHFQPWQDNEGHSGFAWVTLGALGQRTNRVVMGTGVTCPTFRFHPSVVAHGFATLGLLYPGRVFLGVGTGEAINEEAATGQWAPYKERAGRLIESIQLIRQLWTGEVVNFEGKYYRTKSAKLYDVPRIPVPIYPGVQGKNSMRLAGQYGDGLFTDAVSATKPELRGAFEEGARAAGKDPKKMPVIVESWVIVGNEDEARKYAALWQFIPKSIEAYSDNPDPRDIQRRAQQEVPLEEVYGSWAVGDDPKVHIDSINRLLGQGITTIFVHSPQPDQQKIIDFYGRHVLPELKVS